MMKELAAMQAELEAVKRVEEENYGILKEDQLITEVFSFPNGLNFEH